VNGQGVELQLRCAHARWRCGRLDEAAAAAAPALQRIADEDERGHALMCGVAVLTALAQVDWGTRLSPHQHAELCAAAALATSLQGSAAPDRETTDAAGDTVDAPLASTAAIDAAQLSGREREVLERVAAGDSNKLIARTLDISPHTVKRHVANILDKLGLASRGQASAWLRENAAG